jgi:UDP-N-acetylmuramyl pentapeptide phosphotransferase/UDP-N-acetylglucosamine-1-phosphate transferase
MMSPDLPRALPALLVPVAAASICACLILLLRPLLQRYALARPNARSSHVVPTPQGAGIAVIAATLSVAGVWTVIAGVDLPLTLLGATLLIALVGFADDIRPIAVLPRLALQAAVVGAVLLASPSHLRIVPACPLAIERGLILIAGLWFVNLVNFMDGLDLMTAAEVVPITAAMALLGWLGEFPAPATLIAAALCGAVLGFSPFNRPVARVFLGDVGSLPIGLLLGWALLQLAWQHHLVAALLLPLYYLTDATVTLLRRMARREQFWAAHRTHFYQRATDNGYTVAQVIGEVFALNILLGALAVTSTRFDSPLVSLLALLAGVIAVALVLYRFSRVLPQRRR